MSRQPSPAAVRRRRDFLRALDEALRPVNPQGAVHLLTASCLTKGAQHACRQFVPTGQRAVTRQAWLTFKTGSRCARIWAQIPQATRMQLDALWLTSRPDDPEAGDKRRRDWRSLQSSLERPEDLASRWFAMVDQLVSELITPEAFKADILKVMNRNAGKRL